MSDESKPKSEPVGNEKIENPLTNRVKRTSHQPSTHKTVHRGTSPHTGPLMRMILEALDDKRKQALELHHAELSAERSLVAGCYSEAMSDAIEIVKHCAERLASKAFL